MTKHFLSVALFLISLNLSAQWETLIGLDVIPTYSTFNTNGATSIYDPSYLTNIGFSVDFKNNRSIFSTGIYHYTQGADIEFELRDENNNDLGSLTQQWRTKTIAVPLKYSYEFVTVNSFSFSACAGIIAGFLYEDKYLDMDLGIFNDLFVGANAGLGIRYKINESWSLKCNPNMIYQIRENLPEEEYLWTNRILSVNLDVGISYHL